MDSLVVNYLDWLVTELLPGFFSWMNQLQIIPGVSLLGFLIGLTLLTVVVGAILFRV